MTGIPFAGALLSHPHKVLFLWMALVPLIMSAYLFWRASTLINECSLSALGILKAIVWFFLLMMATVSGAASWMLLCYLTSWWWMFYVIGLPELLIFFVFACSGYWKRGANRTTTIVNSNEVV